MLSYLKNIGRKILEKATYSSTKEAGRLGIVKQLEVDVADLSDQYTTFRIASSLQIAMVRCLHAFQVQLIQVACQTKGQPEVDIIDIGDSSGTHLKYLQSKALFPNNSIHAASVNLDEHAVNKIKAKGLEAILCRAEELVDHPDYAGRNVDVFLSFETLEHLFDPVTFLRSIAGSQGDAKFVLTVPFLKKSRVGLHQIRRNAVIDMFAENTHIFELSPEDWKLLFRLAGWKVEYESVFRMFPKRNPLWLASLIWRWFEFDGYYGCVLSKDETYSSRYKSWN